MTRSSFFDEQIHGEPLMFQHVYWMLGHPQTWLALAAWAFFLLGAAKLGLLLWRAGKTGACIALIATLIAFVSAYVWLFSQSLGVFAFGEEPGVAFLAMRAMSWAVLALGITSALWVIRDLWRQSA